MSSRKRKSISERALRAEIKHAHHKIAFPNARTLADVFATFEVKRGYEQQPPSHVWRVQDCNLVTGRRYMCSVPLSRFCAVHSAEHNLSVTPTPELLRYMTENCLKAEGYTYSFEITPRASGSALISCYPSSILASYWLALIPASELPAEVGYAE